MALLQARAAGLDEPDHRRARLAGEAHDADDRLRVRLAERAAHEPGVLGEAEDRPPRSGPGTGEDAIARERALARPARAHAGAQGAEAAGVAEGLESGSGVGAFADPGRRA